MRQRCRWHYIICGMTTEPERSRSKLWKFCSSCLRQQNRLRSADRMRLQPPAVKNVPDYIRCPEMSMPTVKIEGREYIGVLSIPTIDISLPVLSRLSKSGLKAAPCRYVGSAYLDSMVIAAHNYKAHFGKLKELRIGDRLSFTDADGNIFYYEVGEIEILAPDAMEEMTDSDWDLTLFTCTLGGKNRVTVRCFRLNK